MKKTILLSVLLLVLALAAYFLVQNRGPRDTFAENPLTQFAIEDTDILGRIFLADRQGNQILLDKEQGTWFATNKATGERYLARPDAVQSLLEALTKIRTRNSVPKAAVDNVVREIAARGRKVELYDKAGKLLRTYYVGGSADAGQATYMMMEGAEYPFYVFTPGWVGTVDTRYITNPADWRDRRVFRQDYKKLLWVEVEYQDQDQKAVSFKIIRRGNENYEVLPLSPGLAQDPGKLNQANAQTYMEQYSSMGAEVLLHDQTEIRDSVRSRLNPFVKIRYQHEDSAQARELVVYPYSNPSADRGDGEVGTRQKMLRYYIYAEPSDFYMAQHLVLRDFLWGYPFFFQAEEVVLGKDDKEFWQEEGQQEQK